MGSKSEQLLIVVCILEGRHFPKSSRLSLIVQASFDGETLSTDPVEHREQPQFSTELAWELSRRTLHQHRLQRTPIKLQCFAVDSVSKKRESVGYIVLDLRSVQERKQDPRWFPLLNSKYTKLKPALLLSVQLETDSKPDPVSPDKFRAKQAPPRTASPALDLLPDRLQPVLVADRGFHQIGPEDLCSDMFVLSVTVAFATKLQQLIPCDLKLSAEGSDFFFYYTLLGNDITSEPFHSLLTPTFEPERASVRIRSSKQFLHRFLHQEKSLEIHLCCGSLSLGSADVPLAPLCSSSIDLETKAATAEGAFVLKPPKKQTQPAVRAELPTVGVAVTLRREDAPVQTSEPNEAAPSSLPEAPLVPLVPVVSSGPSVQPDPGPDPGPGLDQGPRSPVLSPIPREAPLCEFESEGEGVMDELHQERAQDKAPPADSDTSSLSVSAPKVSIPPLAHHFCFSLDLRSIGNLRLPHPISATLRYQYSFFGSSAPVMTPVVTLSRHSEALLPQSFCAFDFAALPQQLHLSFNTVPLVVELWHRPLSSRDELIGRASLQLSHLLRSPRVKGQRLSSAEQSWRQTHQERVPFLRVDRPTESAAELSYMASLDDLGLVRATEVTVTESTPTDPAPPHPTAPPSVPAAPPVLPPPVPPSGPPPSLVPPRQTLEYRAALELEMWKEEQEDLFDHQLKQKEQSHMQALAEEWKRRDQEREALLQKKEEEFQCLEEQLHKTLSDLEAREKRLGEAELQTERLQRELRAEHSLTLTELKESGRRLQLDCDHRVALERDKSRLLQEERERLLQQISDAEAKYKSLEKEFLLYREQQNMRPELRLQSEINLLMLEKVELERKLESITKSKLHYKQQWGRALKELARFKQREQENAMCRLKKQQQELEVMRLKYLSSEERKVTGQEREELEEIKNQINRLKDERLVPAPSLSGPAPSLPGPAPSLSGLAPFGDGHLSDHLSRLLEERDTLLRTGVYTHEDRIISELNRQIQEVMKGH
ncbi:centrosomal protein of 120 kDa isoform X2 [Periophthalmus magnuspinnatus]|uniref:centrosomal protein of 120 kDa isoform X2 n=1 Tax=Periophthalmus magnuspinnatus TaxID=409849 RepID=UPI00145AF444|nr:centrosomal protein of 120 kDa isoform X2 [Periophthalmus magnuspinnatus]